MRLCDTSVMWQVKISCKWVIWIAKDGYWVKIDQKLFNGEKPSSLCNYVFDESN